MKRPIKLIINGFDVLPYIFAVLIIGGYIVYFLANKGFIPIKRTELLAVICCGIFLLAIINYFKRIHSPKGVSLDSLKSTADIRTPSFRYKNSKNSGNKITYIKFYFSTDTVYLYMRSLIKIYEGPISIKCRDNDSENFHINNFTRVNNDEIEIGMESFNGGTTYDFLMINLSEQDIELLKEKFSKMGYELK